MVVKQHRQILIRSMHRKVTFDTAHHQFYILDKGSNADTGGDFWSDTAFSNRLAIGERLLGVQTESYGKIQTEITLSDKMLAIQDFKAFDHVVEADLEVRSGTIEIADCPTRSVAITIDVPPGNYRIRIYSSNLDDVHEDDGNDFYQIEIWPDKSQITNVLKRYGN